MNKWDLLFKKGIKYKSLNDLFLNKLLVRVEEIIPEKPKNIIDLGCGTGESLVKFSRKGFIVTGVDSSAVAIAKAGDLIKKENKDSTLSIIDLDEISEITNNKFDIIFCKDTYSFVKNKLNFLQNVNKLMHKDSIFILITPVLYNDIKYSIDDKPGIAVDFNETQDILSNNFDSVEVFHHDYFGERGDITTFIAIKKTINL